MTYILSLMALPLLCVLWLIFQRWLARQDPNYQGYQAGCGGCSRKDSCASKGEGQSQTVKKIHLDDTITMTTRQQSEIKS